MVLKCQLLLSNDWCEFELSNVLLNEIHKLVLVLLKIVTMDKNFKFLPV